MKARAVRLYERQQRKDGIFGKVVVEDVIRPVWRVEVVMGDDSRFTSNRKYASEKMKAPDGDMDLDDLQGMVADLAAKIAAKKAKRPLG